MSRTVIFEGVYPDRTRYKAVEEPIVPPPPTTMTFVVAREVVILSRMGQFLSFDMYVVGKTEHYARKVSQYFDI